MEDAMEQHRKNITKLLVIVTLIFSAHTLRAAEPAANANEAADLQDRIDQRAREIAGMSAYSTRLQRILSRTGFTGKEIVELLSFEQKMDRVLPVMHFRETRLGDALNALARA